MHVLSLSSKSTALWHWTGPCGRLFPAGFMFGMANRGHNRDTAGPEWEEGASLFLPVCCFPRAAVGWGAGDLVALISAALLRKLQPASSGKLPCHPVGCQVPLTTRPSQWDLKQPRWRGKPSSRFLSSFLINSPSALAGAAVFLKLLLLDLLGSWLLFEVNLLTKWQSFVLHFPFWHCFGLLTALRLVQSDWTRRGWQSHLERQYRELRKRYQGSVLRNSKTYYKGEEAERAKKMEKEQPMNIIKDLKREIKK